MSADPPLQPDYDRARKAVLLCGQPVEELQGGTAAIQAAFETALGDLQKCNHAGVVVLHVLLCSQLTTVFRGVAYLTGCQRGQEGREVQHSCTGSL